REEPAELAPAFPIDLLVAEPIPQDAQAPPIPGVAPEARHAPLSSESAPGTQPVRYPLTGLVVPGAVSLYLIGCLYFLARLGWGTAPAVPAGATGVTGQSSDLYRRISMLVSNPIPVEQRCPRRWSLLAAVALLSLSVAVAGVGLTRAAAPAADVTKEEKKAD